MVVICWCGHADKHHSTGIPNNCTKCQDCKYFRPIGNNKSYSNKAIIAKFNGACKICGLEIVAEKHKIIRASNNTWIHNYCNDVKL